jgi:hypothetical protein
MSVIIGEHHFNPDHVVSVQHAVDADYYFPDGIIAATFGEGKADIVGVVVVHVISGAKFQVWSTPDLCAAEGIKDDAFTWDRWETLVAAARHEAEAAAARIAALVWP